MKILVKITGPIGIRTRSLTNTVRRVIARLNQFRLKQFKNQKLKASCMTEHKTARA
jgi:hypothetical protein